ncbi:hypothetical protein AAHU43_19665 [Klebsiella variicola subsp. variicola]|uniref:hypothetical protein n=1 Tax=Klebsiella variicola TaxID=244366 RepID=UPI0035A10CA0
MSFTITQNVKKVVSYPEFGASNDIVTENVTVTYSASRVVSLDSSGAAQVIFDVSVDGAKTIGTYVYSFEYSGTGSPIEEAERSLGNALAG